MILPFCLIQIAPSTEKDSDAVRGPRRLDRVRGRRRHLGGLSARGRDRPDLVVGVVAARGAHERDRLPVGRPGRVAADPPQVRQLVRVAAVRVHQIHLADREAGPPVVVGDLPPVRRPGRVVRVPEAPATRALLDPRLPRAREESAFAREDDLRSVGRPGRPVVVLVRVGQAPRPRPVRVHHVDVGRALAVTDEHDSVPSGDHAGSSGRTALRARTRRGSRRSAGRHGFRRRRHRRSRSRRPWVVTKSSRGRAFRPRDPPHPRERNDEDRETATNKGHGSDRLQWATGSTPR